MGNICYVLILGHKEVRVNRQPLVVPMEWLFFSRYVWLILLKKALIINLRLLISLNIVEFAHLFQVTRWVNMFFLF